MPQTEADEKQVVYQFRAPFSAWQDWKSTIPRQKSLETRLNELVRADTDGRVTDADLDAVRRDLARARENQEWSAVDDALVRLEDADDV